MTADAVIENAFRGCVGEEDICLGVVFGKLEKHRTGDGREELDATNADASVFKYDYARGNLCVGRFGVKFKWPIVVAGDKDFFLGGCIGKPLKTRGEFILIAIGAHVAEMNANIARRDVDVCVLAVCVGDDE